MKKWLLSFWFLLISLYAFPLSNAEPDWQFKKSTLLYKKGKYNEAVSEYEALAKTGIQDPALFCNLANAYAETGRRGLAVFYYQKACFLNPLDPDIKKNLETVSGKENAENIEGFINLRAFTTILIQLTKVAFPAGNILIFCSSLICLFSVVGPEVNFKKAFHFPVRLGLLGCLILAVGGIAYFYLRPNADTVVVLKKSEAFSGPDFEANKVAALTEGEELIASRFYKNWYKVKNKAGLEMWVNQQTLGKISE